MGGKNLILLWMPLFLCVPISIKHMLWYGIGLCDSMVSFSTELCNTDVELVKDLDSIYTSLKINHENIGNTMNINPNKIDRIPALFLMPIVSPP